MELLEFLGPLDSTEEKKYVLYLIAFPLVAVFFYGLYKFWIQQRRINSFKSVPVTILSKRLGGGYRVNSMERYPHYPIIEYEYEIAGKRFNSQQVTPYPRVPFYGKSGLFLSFDAFSGAQNVLDQFEESKIYEGYVNPQDPTESFLVKKYDNSLSEAFTFSVFYTVILVIVNLLFNT